MGYYCPSGGEVHNKCSALSAATIKGIKKCKEKKSSSVLYRSLEKLLNTVQF